MHIATRLAIPTDSPRLAKIQVDSYQIGYRGLLPDAFLDEFTYDEQTQDWHDILSDPTYNMQTDPIYVAINFEGIIMGYAMGRVLDDAPCECELRAMHVLKAFQRQGVGTTLIHARAQHFANMGYTSIMLWTLHNNPARAFFEKIGGQLIQEKTDTWDDGTQVTEIAYAWQNIADLIAKTTR